MKRGTEQGLSIIVPSVDERLNAADLRRGIVRSFFWPILQGELVVELEADDGTWSIDAETIATHRTLLPSAEAAVVEFATWASTAKPAEKITLPSDDASRPSWKEVGEKFGGIVALSWAPSADISFDELIAPAVPLPARAIL